MTRCDDLGIESGGTIVHYQRFRQSIEDSEARILHDSCVRENQLDESDKKIVSALQNDGRLSNAELAERVDLSASSCSRRVARLERDGVIVGYRALTNRHALGLSVRAFCGVIRDPGTPWSELVERLAAIDGVVSVFVTSGEVDLLLEIVATDMQQYSRVVLGQVLEVKGVSATRSSFVLEEIKSLF